MRRRTATLGMLLLLLLSMSIYVGYMLGRLDKVAVAVPEQLQRVPDPRAQAESVVNSDGIEFAVPVIGGIPKQRPANTGGKSKARIAQVDPFNPREESGDDYVANAKTIPRQERVAVHVRPAARYEVEIWSKAAIGEYFWLDIFQGKLESRSSGMYYYGDTVLKDVKLRFRTGPGLMPNKVPTDTKNVVLVLNAHIVEKVAVAKQWLDQLRNLKKLRNVGLVVLGSEFCYNKWLDPYLPHVKFVFLVYHDPLRIDNEKVFEWPLGIATYRKFERITSPSQLRLGQLREYTCNMMATVYPNSTRIALANHLDEHMWTVKPSDASAEGIRDSVRQFWLNHSKRALLGNELRIGGEESATAATASQAGLFSELSPEEKSAYPAPYRGCLVANRNEWVLKDSKSEHDRYRDALLTSQFTLCPSGLNVMCYRIFEACEYGSVPIVEDVESSQCSSERDQLTLFKQYNAPFIYVNDWSTISEILERELADKEGMVRRQREVVEWYAKFKLAMRNKFIDVLKSTFDGFQED